MPHPSVLQNNCNENSVHFTPVPFSGVVSSLDSHQAVCGSNPIISQIIFHLSSSIEIVNNKARHNLMDAKCRWHSDQLDRWRCEFWGTAWSNESNANPPEEDSKPPGGNNP